MKTLLIKKLPNFQSATYDDEIIYVFDGIEYMAKTTPFIMDKFRSFKKINDKLKILNGKRTGYGWEGNKRFKLELPTIEEINKIKNNKQKQHKIDYLWQFGSYYDKEQLIDNGFIKIRSEDMDVNKELVKVANLLRTQRDYGEVKKAAILNIGDEVEIENFRIHRYRDSFTVTDLTNAGKRGKIVERFSIDNHSDLIDYNDYYNLIDMIQKCHNYNEAKSLSMGFMNDRNLKNYFSTYDEKGIEVTPKGFHPIKVTGKNMFIAIDYKGFVIRDLVDQNNEPTAIDTDKTGPKQLYRFLSDGNNVNKVKDMRFEEFLSILTELKIRYHYYCAMD